jgi:sialidase-1
MRHLIVICLLCIIPFQSAIAEPASLEVVPVFNSGQDGYHTFRIPAIVRGKSGTLLAFCEGRKKSAGDHGDIDLVLRRSNDDGKSWGSLSVVYEEGGMDNITIGNPAPVVDAATGNIHLLFCRNNNQVCHTLSTDDGQSWSKPVEITSFVKQKEWGWYATGPGHAIQLEQGKQKGRLIVACDYRLGIGGQDKGANGAHVIYSDDAGKTWHLGATAFMAEGINPNETTCVELPADSGADSRIYFNTRNQNGSSMSHRGETISADGGLTFTPKNFLPAQFVTPVVEGSLVHWNSQTPCIVFSCCHNESKRQNLALWLSTDAAANWSQPITVFEGPSAYSDLVITKHNELGILLECGKKSYSETISFIRVNQAWLNQMQTK